MRESLDTLGIKFATDKASQFSRTYAKPHDYLRHLEPFFEPLRDKPIKLIEAGVGGGESIKTWLEYFSVAHIFGVDTTFNTNKYNSPENHPERYMFWCGNQSDSTSWNNLFEKYGRGFAIAIDDGSHVATDMRAMFTNVWPSLVSGGLYVVEDLNFDRNSRVWLEGLISHVHDSTFNIDSIYFARELCVMSKK